MQSLINIKTILLGFFLLSLVTTTYFNKWDSHQSIQHDTKYYYRYLPTFFISSDQLKTVEPTFIAHSPTPSIKMSMGLSLIWLPFFGLAHLIAHLSTFYLPNGYSLPYSVALMLSNHIITLLGFYILYLILLKMKFSKGIVFAVLLSMFLGTTLYYYSTIELMPHTYLFTGITLFVYLCMQWLPALNIWRSVGLGLLLGWISLTRPVDILFVVPIILFVLFHMTWSSIQLYIKTYWLYGGLLIVCVFFVIGLQMVYWKYTTHEWLHWSYGNESFYFLKPHLIDGLIGFRKGWFIYTPLMMLSCFGLLVSPRKVGIAIGLFLILFCYVTFSWWNWWYGGSLGCRPLIDMYVYLAIGLAYSYQYFVNQNKYFIKYIGASVALICVVYGLKLNVQGFYEWIHWDGMTYTSWKKSIWMYKIDKTYLDAMERPNEKNNWRLVKNINTCSVSGRF